MRRGELLGLRWSDLDLDAGRLEVAQQLIVEAGLARLKPVPDRDRRIVALPAWLVGMLLEHRRRDADDRSGGGVTTESHRLVFCAPGGGWLTPERFTRVMEDLIERGQVPRVTSNGLRHVAHLLADPPGEAGTWW